MAKRVFVTRDLPGTALERLRLAADLQVWPEARPPSGEELIRLGRGCDGLVTLLTDVIDGVVLDALPTVRVVSNMAVGYDNVDVPAATARRVLVTNTPGVLTETVADLTFALLLAVARRVVEGDRVVREGRWPEWHPSFLLGRDVHAATLGIVGLGQIGQAVARRARGFDMRVVYTSRTRQAGLEHELGINWASLDDLLEVADFVTLHVPLTDETRGLIGVRELRLMKPTACLINTARGGVIDQPALTAALSSDRLAGAGLDVAAVEPIPMGDPLLKLRNVVITPHIGSASVATRSRMADLAVDNLLAFFEGREPPFCVNREVLSTNRDSS